MNKIRQAKELIDQLNALSEKLRLEYGISANVIIGEPSDIGKRVIEIVRAETGLDPYVRSNEARYVEARYICYLIFREMHLSYGEIAKFFGKERTSVLKVTNTWNGYQETDKTLRAKINKIKEVVYESLCS